MSDENEAEQTNEIGQVCPAKTWVCKESIMGAPLAEGEYETYRYPHTWRIVRFGKKARKALVGRIKWFGEPYIRQTPDRSLREPRAAAPSVVGWELGNITPEVVASCLLVCDECGARGDAIISGEVREIDTSDW